MDLSKMRTPDWILGGCALVLIIDLLFLPWHKVDFDLGPLLGSSGSIKRTAIQSPNSHGRSVRINDEALPILHTEVMRAQSADINGVSGATVTSRGYQRSLQSILDGVGG